MSLKVNEISSDTNLQVDCNTTFIQSVSVPNLTYPDNSTNVVNTAYLTSNYVNIASTQTISGDKYLSGISTAITQAITDITTKIATTQYVSDFVANKALLYGKLAGIQTFTGTNTFNNNLIMDSSAHISLGLTSTTTSVPATFYLGSSVIASQTNSGAMTSNTPFLISTLTLSAGGNYILTANVSALLESITLFTLQLGTTNGGSQLGFMSIDSPANRCFNISGMLMGTIGRNIYLTCTATFTNGTNSITTNNFRFTSMRVG